MHLPDIPILQLGTLVGQAVDLGLVPDLLLLARVQLVEGGQQPALDGLHLALNPFHLPREAHVHQRRLTEVRLQPRLLLECLEKKERKWE